MQERKSGGDGLRPPVGEKVATELEGAVLMVIAGIVGGIIWGLAFLPIAAFLLPHDTWPPLVKAAYFGATLGLVGGGIVGGMVATRSLGIPYIGFFLILMVAVAVMNRGGADAIGLLTLPPVIVWVLLIGVLGLSMGVGLLLLRREGRRSKG